MANSKTKKPQRKEWETIEKIVFALEKFTSENSKVEHNVRIPVTGGAKGRKRQIDVLITQTNGNKMTRYIVEVQKRNSKVSLTTFDGWISKMRSVDCQHLICVSTTGFPKSVLEDVERKHGKNSVILMKLEDFETLVNPETQVNIDLDVDSFHWAFQNKRWDYIEGTAPELEDASKKLGSKLLLQKKDVFFLFNGRKTSFKDMCESITLIETEKPEIRALLQNYEPHDFKIQFKERDNLHLLLGEEKFKILKWDFVLRVKVSPIKFNAEQKRFAYRQVLDNNTLAWVCSTTFTYDNTPFISNMECKTETHSIQVDFVCKLVDGKMQWKMHEHGIQIIP